jgi:2-polyprenyl-6-methoxyphenol hydroxylase-like FAD-dependent oxidoreductase
METPDVRIVGAGPVGLALACALSGHGLNITVHDAGPPEGFASDSRILALSFGTVQLLERLGIGPLPLATPIKTVHVSQKGYLGRTLLRASEYALPCLGQVVRAKDLTQALQKAVCDRGIGIEYHSRLESSTFNAQEGRMTGHLVSTHPDSISDRQPVSARLFAFAEGRIHPETGDAVHEKTYHQHALISLVRPEKPHEHQAWERFTAQGPVALLPFGPEFAVVHTVPSDAAQGLLALEDAAYLRVLERAFGRSVRFVQVREMAGGAPKMNTETHRQHCQLTSGASATCCAGKKTDMEYKRNEYRKVILPLTVLRRFDCLLAPTKTQALQTFNQYKGKPESIIRSVMRTATGYPFYNLSKLELAPSQKGYQLPAGRPQQPRAQPQ